MKQITLRFEPKFNDGTRLRLPSMYQPKKELEKKVLIFIEDDDVEHEIINSIEVRWSRAYVHPDDKDIFDQWVREASSSLGLDISRLGIQMRYDQWKCQLTQR